MRLAFCFLSFSACCSLAFAFPSDNLVRCDSEPSESVFLKAAELADREARVTIDNVQEAIKIDTVFHVVSSSESEADGNLPVRTPPLVILRFLLNISLLGFGPPSQAHEAIG